MNLDEIAPAHVVGMTPTPVSAVAAGDSPQPADDLVKLAMLMREYGNTPVLGPGRTSSHVMAEALALLAGKGDTAPAQAPATVGQAAPRFDMDDWFDRHSAGAQLRIGRTLSDLEAALDAHVAQAVAAAQRVGVTVTSFADWYTGISIEGDMRHNMRRSWDAALASQTVQGQALTALQNAAAKINRALVPFYPDREMRRILDEEGWTWEDLLAAAEAITEEQYADIAAHPLPAVHLEAQSVCVQGALQVDQNDIDMVEGALSCCENEDAAAFQRIKAVILVTGDVNGGAA